MVQSIFSYFPSMVVIETHNDEKGGSGRGNQEAPRVGWRRWFSTLTTVPGLRVVMGGGGRSVGAPPPVGFRAPEVCQGEPPLPSSPLSSPPAHGHNASPVPAAATTHAAAVATAAAIFPPRRSTPTNKSPECSRRTSGRSVRTRSRKYSFSSWSSRC